MKQQELVKKVDDLTITLARVESTLSRVDSTTKNLAVGMLRIEDRLTNVEENMFTKAEGQKLINHVDAVMQRIEVYDGKAKVQDHRLKELEAQGSNHEIRITNLETTH